MVCVGSSSIMNDFVQHYNSYKSARVCLFIRVRLPSSSKTVYSYFVDMDSGNFTAWDALVPTTKSMIEKGAVITIGETLGVSADQNKEVS